LSDEIGIKIPDNAEIIKVKFKRVYDASKYKVIYLENGEKKVVENWIDSDGIQLDRYMKENAESNDNTILSIIIIIVILEAIIPIICLKKLIEEIKR
jgi:hypothetical protein